VTSYGPPNKPSPDGLLSAKYARYAIIATVIIGLGTIWATLQAGSSSSTSSPSVFPSQDTSTSNTSSPHHNTPKSSAASRDGGSVAHPPAPVNNPVHVAAPRVKYLASMQPVGGFGNFESASANAAVFSLNTFASDPMTLTYSVPTGYTSFTANVGLDTSDTKPGVTGFYQLSLDGNPVGSGNMLQVGDTTSVHIRLSGVSQLTMSVELRSGAEDGTPGHVGRLAFGDAAFRR
jgi:hypothetical protein